MSDPIGAFGKPGDVLRVIHDVELQALNAAGLYVAQRYGCMITLGDDPPTFLGSGTLVQIGEQVFVATARHLFEDLLPDQRICAWWEPANAKLCVPRSSVICGPPDLDVAAIYLGSPADTEAVPLSQVGVGDPGNLTSLMVISGISSQFTHPHSPTKTFWAVWWTLGLCPLSRERWPDLQPPPRPHVDLFAYYSNQDALDGAGRRMPAVPPFGLSGGGVWSVSLTGEGVWNPGALTRLVGIQSSTARGTWSWLRATRVEEWLKRVRPALSS